MRNPSFQFANPDNLPRLPEIEHLNHAVLCQGFGIAGRRNQHKSCCESLQCAWAPDKSFLAWSAGHRLIHLIPWDINKQKRHDPNDGLGLGGRSYHILDCGELVHSVAFGVTSLAKKSQRWKHQKFNNTLVLATGHPSGRIKLWNCETGSLLLELLDHKDVVQDLHFASDNSLRLLSASRDGTIKLWEFDEQGDCNMYRTLKTNSKHVFGCRWSPDTKYIAAVGSFKMVMIFAVEGRKCTAHWRLEGHHHDVVSCDFSPDGALLATSSLDTRVIIWDVYTHTVLAQLGHLHPSPRPIYAGGANDHYVWKVAFAPDGSRLASVGEDGFVRLWQADDASDPTSVAQVDGGKCCAFSADGQLLAVGCSNGSLSIFSTPSTPNTLMHLCRSAVRRLTPTPALESLPVPEWLKKYLAYDMFK